MKLPEEYLEFHQIPLISTPVTLTPGGEVLLLHSHSLQAIAADCPILIVFVPVAISKSHSKKPEPQPTLTIEFDRRCLAQFPMNSKFSLLGQIHGRNLFLSNLSRIVSQSPGMKEKTRKRGTFRSGQEEHEGEI